MKKISIVVFCSVFSYSANKNKHALVQFPQWWKKLPHTCYSSTLTIKILKKRYLAHVKREALSSEAKLFLKLMVQEELEKMQVYFFFLINYAYVFGPFIENGVCIHIVQITFFLREQWWKWQWCGEQDASKQKEERGGKWRGNTWWIHGKEVSSSVKLIRRWVIIVFVLKLAHKARLLSQHIV